MLTTHNILQQYQLFVGHPIPDKTYAKTDGDISNSTMANARLLAVLVGLLSSFSLFAGAFAQDEAVLNAELGRLNNQSLYWGPYRPNLYFGVRQRAPNSLLTGLMWSNVDDYQTARDSKAHVNSAPRSTQLC